MNYKDKFIIAFKWQFTRKKSFINLLDEIYSSWWLMFRQDIPIIFIGLISLICNLIYPIWYPIKFVLEPFYAPLIKKSTRKDEHWLKLKEILDKG